MENIGEINIETCFDKLDETNLGLNKYDYVIWLEKYTSKKEYFSDADCLSEPNPENKKYISILYWFYEFICEYAKENSIPSNKTENKSFYSILFNGIGYNIGLLEEQKNICFCERTTIIDNFIDYCDIENYVPKDNVEEQPEKIIKMVSPSNKD